MKNIFRKSFSISMVIILLLANSGLAVFSHTCMLSGSTRLSVLPVTTCHGQAVELPKEGTFQKQGCCAYGFSFLKASHSLVKTRHFVWSKLVPVAILSQAIAPFLTHPLYPSGNHLNSNRPQLFAGASDLLCNICILRI